MNSITTPERSFRPPIPARRWIEIALLTVGLMAAAGCGSAKIGKKHDDFFTSGSREADQRASQTMAKQEQLSGSGEGAGEKGVKKAEVVKTQSNGADGTNSIDGVDTNGTATTNHAAVVEGKLALFDRLGGEAGVSNIVANFLPRALRDPRVNWERLGVSRSAISLGRTSATEGQWSASPENIALLQKHLVQFLALATGGPSRYDGKEIQSTHAAMRITNPEFDATIGDLKASLDKLQVPNREQKELLAIVESTRPQIVTKR